VVQEGSEQVLSADSQGMARQLRSLTQVQKKKLSNSHAALNPQEAKPLR
jgi:hypothetical protein